MRIHYDPKGDAASIRFVEGDHECSKVRLSEDVAVNIAPGGVVVGVEVLDAGENLGIAPSAPKVELENLAAG